MDKHNNGFEKTNSEAEEQDDVVTEEESSEDAEDVVGKLREKLKRAEAERHEYLSGWQKTRAEYANIRKREDEERRDFTKFAEAGLISELVSVLDSFEAAFGDGTEWNSVPETWRSGIKNTYNQLLAILSGHGLETIGRTGDPFDPNIHEAVGTIKIENPEDDHKALEIVQKGYKIHGKLIRPAKVRVGEHGT